MRLTNAREMEAGLGTREGREDCLGVLGRALVAAWWRLGMFVPDAHLEPGDW